MAALEIDIQRLPEIRILLGSLNLAGRYGNGKNMGRFG